MAKSRSESLLRSALSLRSLRGAEGDEAISRGSPRGREECLARAKYHCFSSLRGAQRRSNLKMGSLK
ncbi:MAG: hypothetical protein ABSF21_01790 [Dehalococcoidia bacterium]